MHKSLWSIFLCVVPEIEVVENAESDKICHHNLLLSTFAPDTMSSRRKFLVVTFSVVEIKNRFGACTGEGWCPE